MIAITRRKISRLRTKRKGKMIIRSTRTIIRSRKQEATNNSNEKKTYEEQVED